MNREKKYVYKSTLGKVYGLTPAMIAELGEGDKSCENPHWKCGPSASLYCVKRVEAWVAANKERLERVRESRVRRAAAARAVWEEKRRARFREAEEWVNTVAIEVAPLPDTLIEDARLTHRNLSEKGLRAHVRHRLTNYESLLEEARRLGFQSKLYPVLRQRVDAVVGLSLDEWRGHARPSAGGFTGPPPSPPGVANAPQPVLRSPPSHGSGGRRPVRRGTSCGGSSRPEEAARTHPPHVRPDPSDADELVGHADGGTERPDKPPSGS